MGPLCVLGIWLECNPLSLIGGNNGLRIARFLYGLSLIFSASPISST